MKSSRIPRRFRSRISFVGNSMVEAADHWFRQLPQDPDLEAVTRLAIPLQMQNHRMPMAEVLETIARDQGLRIDFADPADNVNFQAALVWKATLEYRKNLVEGLRTFGIRVYGDMGWHRIVNGEVKIRAPVSYYRELPMVFNGTDLNINATSFQMTTAVNQRVFDSAACGAFLVTDHQADMDILFDPKSEAVCYGDLGQARDQVAYYLNHETERRRIADKARKRVISEHTYAHRLQRMIRILKNEFESS